MAALKWNRLIGQERVKGVVGSAFQSGTLGHAYLFCGERGIGKFAAAVDLAMALLCQNAETRPCAACPSCRKAGAYSHPDFHVVMPLVLQAEHRATGGALTEEGWQFAAESAKNRIDDPYRLPRYSRIPLIPVDWVREVDHAIQRGATEGAFNVAIIDGVDTMGKESANAMLKTLEESPPGTVMILLTDKPHAVLPTIVSRYQIMRFALLPPDIVGAERLAGGDDAFSPCRKTLLCLAHLQRFAFLSKFGAPASYFNETGLRRIDLPEPFVPNDAWRCVRLCQEALDALDARGNCTMVMVHFVCSLMDALNDEERYSHFA